jgi:hypothetical protein
VKNFNRLSGSNGDNRISKWTDQGTPSKVPVGFFGKDLHPVHRMNPNLKQVIDDNWDEVSIFYE